MSFHADVNLSYEEYNFMWDTLHERYKDLMCRVRDSSDEGLTTETKALVDEHKMIIGLISKLEARFQH